jgi:hypothetical protein
MQNALQAPIQATNALQPVNALMPPINPLAQFRLATIEPAMFARNRLRT